MLRLTTFGGVTLTSDGGSVSGATTGRRRLALLVLLAAAGDQGMSRDAVSALLWPEGEPEQARHSLEQALYATRRAIDADDLFLGPTPLRLNPAAITTDTGEFEVALRSRQLERAVALYRGPFAAALSIEGSGELQQRVDAIRTRYAREYIGALETLARAAGARGDHTACVRWWRRHAEADPLSARVARELIEALVAAGEHAHALQFAIVHESLVRQELDTPAAPEVVSWIHRLRGLGVGHPAATVSPLTPSAGPTPEGGRREPTEADADREQRQLARLTRVVGRRYRIGRRIEESAIIAAYAAATTETPSQDVELHLVQPAVSTGVRSDRFVEVLGRVIQLADLHILPTFDAGATEETFFYVTSRRPPRNLRERLRRERELPMTDAVRIARDVAAALAHAHARGVRHGDLRPKHVHLTSDGALVGAFGVVDALTAEADAGGQSTVVTFGAPAYLSPEQLARHGTVDERSDVYALGCILYEMLAGEPPFGGPGRVTVLARKLTQTPPQLRSVRDRVPEALERVVQMCLARVSADRYASGLEVAQALTELDVPSR